MIHIEKGEQKPREIVPVKNHVARLYSIVEIGHVPNDFPGKEGTFVHEVRMTWELPNEMRDFDGKQKPMVIGGKYTISMYEKANLRKVVDGMLGGLSEEDVETFNIKSLLGTACLLQTGQRTSKAGNKYAYVISTSQLPEGLKAPQPFNDEQYLDYSADGWSDEVYGKLPQFVKDDMEKSQEMQKRGGFSEKEEESIDPESIPF